MTNAQQLYDLMMQHGLTRREAADMISYSLPTINAWLAPATAKKHRPMPDRALESLKLRLQQSTAVKLIDENGRVGRVTEDHGSYLFAAPADQPYTIDAIHPGVGRAQYITATSWHKQSDGSYRGIWFDAPVGADSLTARISE